MSPNEQKITPGRAAIARALSIISSGVTHTGQPGPWISSISGGSSWSIPLRMIECVCPPQTSMIAQGRVVIRRISSNRRAARSGSRYSSRYFMLPLRAGVELLVEHAQAVEQLQRLKRGLLVEPGDREADV